MGLAITVGIIGTTDPEGDAYYRAALDRLAAALERAGVTGYREPAGRVVTRMRAHVASFPYSFLHYLRRVVALQAEGMAVTPATGDDALARASSIVADATSMLSSHLLCHSDVDGYYVPVELDGPHFFDKQDQIAGGGMVGSSQALLRELRRVAPALGVALQPDGTLGDAEAARIDGLGNDGPYWRELVVWLTLHEASVASIASGAAIVFH